MLPDERDKVYKCTIVDFSLAYLLLYIGVSRSTIAKFRPETDAFIEISNLTQSLPHNQIPTSKFQVPSTRVKWVDDE